jgi:hypothetical protein
MLTPAGYASIIDVPRRAWDPTEGRHPLSGSRPLHQITGVEVHWVGTGAVGDHGDTGTELASFERFHERSKGWSDLFYNVGLDSQGITYEGRDVTVRSQSDLTSWLTLLCVLGNGDRPTDDELQNFKWGIWRVWGAVDPSRNPRTLRRHNDRSSSACPGHDLTAIVQQLQNGARPKEPTVTLHADAQKAADKGIWSGSDPDAPITREHAAIMAWRAYSKAVADAERGEGLKSGDTFRATVI